jgi:D-sedoheptulose 7-phosphate isomerase
MCSALEEMMTPEELIDERTREAVALKEKSLDVIRGPLAAAAAVVTKVLKAGNKVLSAGNGGSAADAQHLEAELVGRFLLDRPGLAAMALTTNPSTVTAIINDYPAETLFSRQVEALGTEGDVFVGFSTSGNSPNVVNALATARDKGLITIGVTGKGGGRMAHLCDVLVAVPSESTPRIQEVHLLVVHLICELVERALFGE